MLALQNGTIIDGTGRAPYTGTVLVDGERISVVHQDTAADTSFDCEGLAISPGFFDLHSHSDIQALDPARRRRSSRGLRRSWLEIADSPSSPSETTPRNCANSHAESSARLTAGDGAKAAITCVPRRHPAARRKSTHSPGTAAYGLPSRACGSRSRPKSGAACLRCSKRRWMRDVPGFRRTDVRTGICRGFRRTHTAAACRRETRKAVRDTMRSYAAGWSTPCASRSNSHD